MLRKFLLLLLSWPLLVAAADNPTAVEPVPAATPAPKVAAVAPKKSVVVIPVRDEIARPILYILRRGLKEAIDQKADVIVLDIKTPGGALDVTFDILEALDKFPGKTVAYVNNEAMSAGAFISAMTEEIWFAPDGIIGAAAPVTSTGQDVDKTMRLKIVSYLKARMRAISEGKGYRGQVISAMIDEDSELKIGDKVLKEKGELLSLTAKEASLTYGEPAQPLLAAGMAKSIRDLLGQKFGNDGYALKTLEITWSERLAVFMNSVSPILLGLGLLALFIEFKTPGFGFFGIAGIALLVIVFLGNYVAGLSGHEPILVFAVGLLLLGVEIFFVPGSVVIGLSGVVLMLGSLVWSMADIWPNQPVSFSGEMFLQPVMNVGLGLAIAAVLAVLLLRFLPHGWFWGRMVLETAVSTTAQTAGSSAATVAEVDTLVGRRAVAVTALRPFGHVEIDGRRYEAQIDVGSVEAGATVVVRARSDFGLSVERADA